MDEQSFSTLVEQYERLVYSICYQFTRNHHTAEDLAQDTFLSVYLHRDSCPADNPKAWISRIAVNKAKDHLKSAWNRKVHTPGDEALPEAGAMMAAAAPQPEEALLEKEGCRKVRQAIGALRAPYGQVANLYFLHQRDTAEISAALHRPYKTVQTQLYRAKGQLAQALQPPA